MHPKPLYDSSLTLVRDENGHSHDLLLALSRAAQSIQRARTAEDFYRAVGNEVKSLGGETTLLLINQHSPTLSIAYTSYSPSLIRKAEKITGCLYTNIKFLFQQKPSMAAPFTTEKQYSLNQSKRPCWRSSPPPSAAG